MRSSWFLAHRIRKAMERKDDGSTLKGVVAADESVLDGHHARPPRRSQSVQTVVSVLFEKNKTPVPH